MEYLIRKMVKRQLKSDEKFMAMDKDKKLQMSKAFQEAIKEIINEENEQNN